MLAVNTPVPAGERRSLTRNPASLTMSPNPEVRELSQPMSRSALGIWLSCVLAVLMPAQLMGGEVASAMLYASGSAWVNGGEVLKSAALFPGDMLQTPHESPANIQAVGSNALVLPESLVKYQGSGLEIEHGGVRVMTSRGLAVQAGEVRVKPVAHSWTEFQVMDVDGRVQIAVKQGDVQVQDSQGTSTVSQGQQTTRDDTSNTEKRKRRRSGGAATAAAGGLLSSTAAIYAGLAAAGGVGIWLLLREEPPMSGKCVTVNCQ